MIVIREADVQAYFQQALDDADTRAHLVKWARGMVRGREEYVTAQLARLAGAIRARGAGYDVPPPPLSPEGVAGLILLTVGEVVIEGEHPSVVVDPRGRVVVRVGEKRWVYRFSPPKAKAPKAESSVGARARLTCAR
jgi:hypothetical protein